MPFSRQDTGLAAVLPRFARPLARALAAVATALVLASCRVDTAVSITVAEDGSGLVEVTVAADPELIETRPDVLESVALDDLRDGGWTVTRPIIGVDGWTRVTLSRPFADAADLRRVMGQLNGPSGPLGPVRLTIDDAWDRTTWRLETFALLTDELRAFSDPELDALVGDVPLADVVGERPVAESFGLTLDVTLPGEPGEFHFEPDLRGGTRTPIIATSTEVDEGARRALRVALVGLGAMAAYALGWVGLGWRRRRRHRRAVTRG